MNEEYMENQQDYNEITERQQELMAEEQETIKMSTTRMQIYFIHRNEKPSALLQYTNYTPEQKDVLLTELDSLSQTIATLENTAIEMELLTLRTAYIRRLEILRHIEDNIFDITWATTTT